MSSERCNVTRDDGGGGVRCTGGSLGAWWGIMGRKRRERDRKANRDKSRVLEGAY